MRFGKIIIGEAKPIPDICPQCGVSWNTVREMLKEPRGSDNRDLVDVIIANCSECRKLLKGEENETVKN